MSTENNNVWVDIKCPPSRDGRFEVEIQTLSGNIHEVLFKSRGFGHEWIGDNGEIPESKIVRWRLPANTSYNRHELTSVVAQQAAEIAELRKTVATHTATNEEALKLLDKLSRLSARYREELDEAFRRTSDLQARLIVLEKGGEQ